MGRKPSSVPRFGHPGRGGDHSSGTTVAGRLMRLTRETRAGHPRHPHWDSCSLFSLAPGGVCHANRVAAIPVRSYRTISPLPRRAEAEFFLWHYPRGRPHRALPGTLPCGARTFLQPAAMRTSDHLDHSDRAILQDGVRLRQGEILDLDLETWVVYSAGFSSSGSSCGLKIRIRKQLAHW